MTHPMMMMRAVAALALRVVLLGAAANALADLLGLPGTSGAQPVLLLAVPVGLLLLTVLGLRPLPMLAGIDVRSLASTVRASFTWALLRSALLLVVVLAAGAGLSALLGASAVTAAAILTGFVLSAREVLRPPAASTSEHDPRPGELWWASIPFEESSETKDRPCLVLRVRGDHLHVLMVTSQDRSRTEGFLPIPVPSRERTSGKERSYLRLDRVIMRRRGDLRRRAWRLDEGSLAAVEAYHRTSLRP